MKPTPAFGKFMCRIGILGALLLILGLLPNCTALSPSSSTYYPQAKDEEAYRSRYKPLKDQLADDEGAIYQSHADAKRGLNLPGDQPGTYFDGVGYSTYH
jgi:hypothetical protein